MGKSPDAWNKRICFSKFFFQLKYIWKYLLKHSPITGTLVQFHFYLTVKNAPQLLRNCKTMISIVQKLVFLTGTLKENFWRDELSVSGKWNIYLSIYLFIYLFIFLFIYSFIYLLIYLFEIIFSSCYFRNKFLFEEG